MDINPFLVSCVRTDYCPISYYFFATNYLIKCIYIIKHFQVIISKSLFAVSCIFCSPFLAPLFMSRNARDGEPCVTAARAAAKDTSRLLV